jgi:hypothetical protein
MGQNEVKMLHKIIGEMKNKSSDTEEAMGQLVQQFQNIGGYLQHLEQGVFAVSRELQILKKANEMVLNMFIEAEVYSQEEVNEKFRNEVIAPVRALEEERNKKMQEAIAAQLAAQEQEAVVLEPVQDNVEEPEDTGEPVLASERNNVIVFGRKEEEHA